MGIVCKNSSFVDNVQFSPSITKLKFEKLLEDFHNFIFFKVNDKQRQTTNFEFRRWSGDRPWFRTASWWPACTSTTSWCPRLRSKSGSRTFGGRSKPLRRHSTEKFDNFRILLQFQLKCKIRRHVFLPTTTMEGDIFLNDDSSDHIFKNNLPCSECALFSFGTQQTPKNWCCKFKF